MKKTLTLIALLIIASLTISGCCGNKACPISKCKHGEKNITSDIKLCGHCGEVKGTEQCCNKSAEKCDGCGLIKGSPGCCKIEQGDDVTLCSHCGQIKGSEKCCDPNAELCSCGYQKGSSACCKL